MRLFYVPSKKLVKIYSREELKGVPILPDVTHFTPSYPNRPSNSQCLSVSNGLLCFSIPQLRFWITGFLDRKVVHLVLNGNPGNDVWRVIRFPDKYGLLLMLVGVLLPYPWTCNTARVCFRESEKETRDTPAWANVDAKGVPPSASVHVRTHTNSHAQSHTHTLALTRGSRL